MSSPSGKKPHKQSKKVRVPFRRNRSKKKRDSNLTRQVQESEGFEINAEQSQRVIARGDLSRHRTIRVHELESSRSDIRRGIVVEFQGGLLKNR